MSTKLVRLFVVGGALLLFVGLLARIQGTATVHAQSPTQSSAPACITCHENQYYLYDAGTWYCITEARDRCVNCHAGDANALTEQEAHVGLVANPFGDSGKRCQECHAEDAEAYIQEVAGFTGYHESIAEVPYVPQTADSNSGSALLASLDEPEASLWFIPAVVAVFLFWLFLVIRSNRS